MLAGRHPAERSGAGAGAGLTRETQMSLTERMAVLCAGALARRAGPAELENARLCVIDGLAVALAAADSEPIRILWDTVGGGAPDEATVIGLGHRCRADAAAL